LIAGRLVIKTLVEAGYFYLDLVGRVKSTDLLLFNAITL